MQLSPEGVLDVLGPALVWRQTAAKYQPESHERLCALRKVLKYEPSIPKQTSPPNFSGNLTVSQVYCYHFSSAAFPVAPNFSSATFP